MRPAHTRPPHAVRVAHARVAHALRTPCAPSAHDSRPPQLCALHTLALHTLCAHDSRANAGLCTAENELSTRRVLLQCTCSCGIQKYALPYVQAYACENETLALLCSGKSYKQEGLEDKKCAHVVDEPEMTAKKDLSEFGKGSPEQGKTHTVSGFRKPQYAEVFPLPVSSLL